MDNRPSEELKNLLGSYLKAIEEKYPQIKDTAIMQGLDSLDADKWKEGTQKIQLKEQRPLQDTDIRQAMVYAKKELVQIRQATQSFIKELKDLPTYQYIKPQVDGLISATDDLEALVLNRFNEQQMKEKSAKDWETLQKIRMFLIQQLLKTYKK